MCPYAKYDEKNTLICGPKKTICLLCVLGNSKRYNEIEKENEEEKLYE